MKTYSEKLKDPRWQKKRLEIMQRDKFTCRDCGEKTKTLNVHHCHYQRGEPWSTGNDLLLTLCEECHDSRGCVEHDLKLEFARVLAQLSPEAMRQLIQDFIQVSANDKASNAKCALIDEDVTSWVNGAVIKTSIDYEWEMDIRWYREADANPAGRDLYCAVIGRNPWAEQPLPAPTNA